MTKPTSPTVSVSHPFFTNRKKSLRLIHQSKSPKVYNHSSSIPPRSPLLRLNTLCPYYTMFPLDFPLGVFQKAKPGEWVLDPFCGRGTTLFAARLRGLSSVGIDCNPIAAAVAEAKLANTSPQAVIELAESLLQRPPSSLNIPTGTFWELCYHPETLTEICILREALLHSCSSPEAIVLRALLLGVLHGPLLSTPSYLSNQMPRTYATKPAAAIRFWMKNGLTLPPRVPTLELIKRKAHYSLSQLPPPTQGMVFWGDSRQASSFLPKDIKFQWVVTSPPYLGMATYGPDQWLRNWFLGGADKVDYHQEGQISHSVQNFVDDLAQVWRTVAHHCTPRANLIVRFGQLPSKPIDALAILKESFHKSQCGWSLTDCSDAGSAAHGLRQANQFQRKTKSAVHELDVVARLEG